MTYSNHNPLSQAEQKRLICVENDVRRAMKEACRPYAAETKAAIDQRRSRVLLASQIGKLLITLSVLFCVTGCGMFIRKVDAWGLVMEFPEGLDFHAGANGIDKVEDRRGISPLQSYSQPLVNPKGKY